MTSGRRTAAVAAALGSLVMSACAPDPSDAYTVDASPATRTEPDVSLESTGETFPASGASVEIRALDNVFRDDVVEIEAGTEIRWLNAGRNEHNVLPATGVDGFGVERDEFVPGDDYAHVFDTVGVFAYFCSIHGTEDVGMIGTVVVTAPA